MPRRYHLDNGNDNASYHSKSPRRYSIPSTGVLETATRGRPHRASKDLIFVDPKVAYIDRDPYDRSPSPRRRKSIAPSNQLIVIKRSPSPHYRRQSVQSNQLVVRQKPRYRDDCISPVRNSQLVIRQRTRSESRGREDEPYQVKKKIDQGDTVVRSKSRPGRRSSLAFVRKPKHSNDEKGYDTDYVTRKRRKSVVARRRRSEEFSSDSDDFDRRSVDWDKARVVNLERRKTVEVDELDEYKYRRGSRYEREHRSGHRRDDYPDDVSTSSLSTRTAHRGYDSSPNSPRDGRRDRDSRQELVPVLIAPVYDHASRGPGRHRSVDFGGQETIPRGSVAGSSYAPSNYSPRNTGRRPPVVTQPILVHPSAVQQGVPVSAQPVQAPQGGGGLGQYFQQGNQYLRQGEGFVRTGEGLARLFN